MFYIWRKFLVVNNGYQNDFIYSPLYNNHLYNESIATVKIIKSCYTVGKLKARFYSLNEFVQLLLRV